MKRTLMVSLLFAATLTLFGATPAEEEVEKLDAAWGKAIVAKDIATLDKLLADDLIYGHASNVVDTKKTYLEKIRGGKQVYATLERKKVSVRMLEGGNTAITHSWMHVTGVNPQGKFDDIVMMLHVWNKRGSAGWKLVAHQTAKVDRIPD
jgi:ketosteroid isomerase-like protein